MELWKAVIEYEGLYEISDLGKLKNLKTGHITCGHKNQLGYMVCGLRRNGKSKSFFIHRLVAAAHIENPDNKPLVNHKNGVRHDNRVINLEWATVSENVTHGVGIRQQLGTPKYRYEAPNYYIPDEPTFEERKEMARKMFTQLHYREIEKKNKKIYNAQR